MAQTIVPPSPRDWLAERGLIVGARVGNCIVAYAPLGTVVAVAGLEDISVRWDDGRVESVSWVVLAPNGYVLDPEPLGEMLTVQPSGLVYWSAAA